MSPHKMAQAIRDAGREPPTQIGFYVNQLCKARAIRRVAHGLYRPNAPTPRTRVFFPQRVRRGHGCASGAVNGRRVSGGDPAALSTVRPTRRATE